MKILAPFSSAFAAAPLEPSSQKPATLLNVSYDPTRELYQDFNGSLPPIGRKRPARM